MPRSSTSTTRRWRSPASACPADARCDGGVRGARRGRRRRGGGAARPRRAARGAQRRARDLRAGDDEHERRPSKSGRCGAGARDPLRGAGAARREAERGHRRAARPAAGGDRRHARDRRAPRSRRVQLGPRRRRQPALDDAASIQPTARRSRAPKAPRWTCSSSRSASAARSPESTASARSRAGISGCSGPTGRSNYTMPSSACSIPKGLLNPGTKRAGSRRPPLTGKKARPEEESTPPS